MSLLAITGGTGFVGGHLLRIAVARGHRVRALTRRTQPAADGIEWVAGAHDKPESLRALCAGADAVIHVAGTISARDRSGFEAGNVAGTRNMIAAAREGDVPRFVHVSSLAAREPALSDYGWSKRESEAIVAASGLDWTIVRPPAIYGPGDREILELFRAARLGLVPLPPAGRLSVVAVQDLCRLLLGLAEGGSAAGRIYEPTDGRAEGWTHREFARALGRAVGRSVLPLPMPAALIRAGAWLDGRVRGAGAKLTPDRARYMCHPDWVSDPARQPPISLWRPEIDTPAGLEATARWYRAEGWL